MSCDCLAKLAKVIGPPSPDFVSYSQLRWFLEEAQGAAHVAPEFTSLDVLDLSPAAFLEFKRMRAIEKWVRETAVPALEQYEKRQESEGFYCGLATAALAIRPKDGP